jgi:DNA processing protein
MRTTVTMDHTGERSLTADEAIVLSAAGGYAAARLGRVARHCRSLDALLTLSDRALLAFEGVGEKTLPLIRRIGQIDPARERSRLDALGVSVIVPGEPGWPLMMSENVGVPPLALYVRGDPEVLGRPGVAIVGTRRPTDGGTIIARRLGGDLGRIPLNVISGLATGIDAEAHRGCLEGGGCTVAVLAHGLDRVHPKGNEPLARQILDGGGALVSEYHPGFGPMKETFVPRNRIIAGLSLATVVVEGREDSGARHTAAYALEYDRTVLAVPGSPLEERSDLPNQLLSAGATVCRGAWDAVAVLETWQIEGLQEALADRAAVLRRQAGEALRALGSEAEGIVASLADEPLHVDGICLATGLPPERVLALLLQLEIEGIVEQLPGMRFTSTFRATDGKEEAEAGSPEPNRKRRGGRD